MKLLDNLAEAVVCVRKWLGGREPALALVIGSGLSSILSGLNEKISLEYVEIPGFAATGIAGHAGCLHYGSLFGRSVLVFQGRYHCYEGYSAWQVTATVRLAAELGCRQLLLTNAAGGIAETMQTGDYMLVTDHLNMVGENPLRGRPEADFIDLTELYRHSFYQRLRERLEPLDVRLHAGVLAWMLGPNYETPAEIKMLKTLGAAAVSMSTIPEAIVAKRLELDVVAISYISNLAAGSSAVKLDHQEVLASGQNAASSLEYILVELFNVWPG